MEIALKEAQTWDLHKAFKLSLKYAQRDQRNHSKRI